MKAPGFGDRRKAMLQDMAVLTGAPVVSEDLGIKLENVTIDPARQAKQVKINKDSTTIIQGAGKGRPRSRSGSTSSAARSRRPRASTTRRSSRSGWRSSPAAWR